MVAILMLQLSLIVSGLSNSFQVTNIGPFCDQQKNKPT